MAKTLNAENVASAGSNSALSEDEKDAVIRDVAAQVAGFEADIASIRETMKSLLHTDIKGRCGMPIGVFRARRELATLEPDERDAKLAAERRMDRALGVSGPQLDMELGKTAGPVDKDGFATQAQTEVSEAEAYNAGFKAGQAGSGLEACAYPAHQKRLVTQWQTGWSDAKAAAQGNVTPIASAKRGPGRPKKGGQPVTEAERAAAKPTEAEMAAINAAPILTVAEAAVLAREEAGELDDFGDDSGEEHDSVIAEATRPIDGAGIRERLMADLPTAADDEEL